MIKNKRKNNREWTPTPEVQVFSARKTVGSETIIRDIIEEEKFAQIILMSSKNVGLSQI